MKTKAKMVWVVSSGEYSGYALDGIFSTRKNAEEFIRLLPDALCDGVEEIELDPMLPYLRRGMGLWRVLMLRDGTTESVEEYKVDRQSMPSSPHICRRGKGVQDVIFGMVWAKDARHAAKIVNERRVELIASGEWDEEDAGG